MAEIFTPFLIAFILAYALRPVCLWLEKHRLPRGIAAGLAVLFGLALIFGILSLFIGLLKYEIPLIKAQIPNWVANTQSWLGPKLGELHVQFDWSTLKLELVYRRDFETHDQARHEIFDFIEVFYNPKRRHSTLDRHKSTIR